MSWSTLIGHKGDRWVITVCDENARPVARIFGSEGYVLPLAEAMCERRSIDVSDMLARRAPRPVAVVPSHARWGPLTNVIRCEFNQGLNCQLNGGALRETQLGHQLVRAMVSESSKAALRRVVQGRPVANDNDPELKTQPHWYNKVQSAWVRRMAAKRGAAHAD